MTALLTRWDILKEVPRFIAAWSEGAQSCLDGRPLSDNPYLPDTVSGRGWASGWSGIDQEISALPATDRHGPTP